MPTWARIALVGVPVAFLAYFFVYPVVSITVRGLAPEGAFDLGAVLDVLRDEGLRSIAWFTLWQAAASTVITVVVAFPAAWAFARFDFAGKRILEAVTLVPFVLPTLVVGTAFLALVGPRGALGVDLTGSVWLILIAHVFYNYAIVVRGVGAYWARMGPSTGEAATLLGAPPWTVFRTVTLPMLRPAITSASALVFLFSFTSFGVVLLLGDLSTSTIEVEIWRQATAFLRLDVAAILAILQMIGVGVILVLYGRYQRRTTVTIEHETRQLRRPTGRRQRLGVGLAIGSMIAIIGIPLGFLVARSFVEPGGHVGLGNYTALTSLATTSAAFSDPWSAVGNSLRFALAATLIALVIGIIASAAMTYTSERTARSFDTFVMLPLGTSAVTIGFGFLVALDWPIDLRATLVLIPIAHALVGIPFVVRTTSPTLASIDRSLRDAAATLGAGPLTVWRTVDLPLVTRVSLVAGAFAFAVSMGEFGATAFIARPDTPTMPIAIFRLLGRPGGAPFGAAIAMCVLLMAITALAIIAIESTRRERKDAW
ncbi:MAG: iron ABC transporter permease [Acidimicrobiia bacterium]|nr:iron ABC transporter permease [Acidimicrobiia bacterium]